VSEKLIKGDKVSETVVVQPRPAGSGLRISGIVLLVLAILGGSFGFVWTATFYISQGQFPVGSLGTWNLLVGGFFFAAGIPMLIIAIVLLALSRKRLRSE